MKKKLKTVQFSIFLRAGNADSGPPLSTILGNYGVNTMNFCKDFNEKTKLLPNYILLEVFIAIDRDRTYKIGIKEMSVAYILKLIVRKTPIYKKGQGGFKIHYLKTVSIRDVYFVSLLKYKSIDKKYIKAVCAVIFSSNYFIRVDENDV